MNKLSNYFSFLSLKEHESLRLWYRASLTCLSLLVFVLLGITCMQWSQLKTLYAQKNKASSITDFSQLMQKKESLEKQKDMYLCQLNELKKMYDSTDHMQELLNYIARTIPEDVALNQITYQNKQDILITGRSRSLVCLNQFVDLIKKNTLCKNVSVNSINQSHDASNQQQLITFKVIVSQ